MVELNGFMHCSAQNLASGGSKVTSTTEKDAEAVIGGDQKTKVAEMQTSKAPGKCLLIAHHAYTQIENTVTIPIASNSISIAISATLAMTQSLTRSLIHPTSKSFIHSLIR